MRKRGFAWWLAGLVLLACGGSNPQGQPPASGAPAATTETAASSASGAAPSSSAAPSTAVSAAPTSSASASASAGGAAPAGKGDAGGAKRPFASTSQEATEYIDVAVESRRDEVEKCVTAARERRKSPHAEISVELGIDEQGTLVGVKTPRGQPQDKALVECVRAALFGAPFPSSKAGVITLKKTFSDQIINKR